MHPLTISPIQIFYSPQPRINFNSGGACGWRKRKLKKIWKCDRVVSFGDAINDIPMFEISDECYAVENAVEELKVIADGVIESNEENGVAKWLERAGCAGFHYSGL